MRTDVEVSMVDEHENKRGKVRVMWAQVSHLDWEIAGKAISP